MNWGNSLLRTVLLCLCLLACLGNSQAPLDVKPLMPICLLQGDGYSSRFQGGAYRVRGVVTLDYDAHWRKGFHLQEADCDGDLSTSDGIYVYLDEKVDVVNVGDQVEVSGVVQEYYGLTELLAEPDKVQVLSSGNALPPALELNPPFENEAARAYFEARESMLVRIEQGRVVGPTDADGRTWLVNRQSGIERVFHGDPAGTGEVICVEDEGPYEISPGAYSGDLLSDVVGVLAHRAGLYCQELTTEPNSSPSVAAGQPEYIVPSISQTNAAFSIATFNLYNLFDTLDDPLTEDSVLSGAEYQRRLTKRAMAIHDALGEPTLISVQEAENLDVLLDMVGQPEIQSTYSALLTDGPDRRGIDVGVLYRRDQVQVLYVEVRQGCTQLVDGLGPDGSLEMEEPQNAITCDSDGDQILDGNRLFSRPPLVAKVKICPTGFQLDGNLCTLGMEPVQIWLINAHLKSKLQDTSTTEVTLPRRLEQSQFLMDLAEEIIENDSAANLLLLGDLNDYLDSQTLAILEAEGLANLAYQVTPSERYTYIYRGISQFHDYILARHLPTLVPIDVQAVHTNADYPYELMSDGEILHRSSDHDMLWARFGLFGQANYLPQVMR